jgi:hypothetical protein
MNWMEAPVTSGTQIGREPLPERAQHTEIRTASNKKCMAVQADLFIQENKLKKGRSITRKHKRAEKLRAASNTDPKRPGNATCARVDGRGTCEQHKGGTEAAG